MEIEKFCVINTIALAWIFPMEAIISMTLSLTFFLSSVYFVKSLKKCLQLDDDIV